MDRALPVFNRFLGEKWQQFDQSLHEKRLYYIHKKSGTGSIPKQEELIKSNNYKQTFSMPSRKHMMKRER